MENDSNSFNSLDLQRTFRVLNSRVYKYFIVVVKVKVHMYTMPQDFLLELY